MKKLSKGKIYRFFMCDVAKGLFNGMIGNYLLYFYQPTAKSGILSLLPENKFLGFITIMALLTAIGKVIDAITDPIVAQLSDRCKSKWGRRMPFLRIAAIPYALCVFLVFMAPFNPGNVLNAIWVGVFLVLYYTAYTIFYIPHRALVPEIIPNPKERVGYYAVSTALFMGSSAVMYATTLFVSFFKNMGMDAIWAWRSVFAIFAIVGMICLLISAFSFHEPDYIKETSHPTDSILKSFGIVLKNKNFVIFSLGDLASYISMAFFQTSMLYYITILLNIKESLSFLVMAIAIATSIALFPLIVKISKKVNKKMPLIIGSWVFAAVFTFIFFADNIAALVPGYELILGIIMGLTVSFPFACINILPQSILSDIIQQDTIVSGVRREGIFSAIKTFIDKIAYAVAMMIVSSVLAIGAIKGESVGLLGIKLTGIFACVFSLISVIFFMIYDDKSVTKTIEEHNKIKENE
jgi:GPH family glycoside/pentoside/hexuronide:cation symporter